MLIIGISAVAGTFLSTRPRHEPPVDAVVGPTEVAESEVRLRVRSADGVRVTEIDPAPLIYIDGVRTQRDAIDLDQVDPDDVERVEVIKGNAAVAMYGREAAGGVILIFLKHGEASGSR
jgi:TonB-dependent SusC/RagA subfamily outer membrane receptor